MPFWQRRPNLQWLACLRNEANERKERKEKSWTWEILTTTIPYLLVTNIPTEWPLLASLGSQYACNIPLFLTALHLYWFQKFYDLNYTTNELCLPYFGCTVLGFNELFSLKMEQNIEKKRHSPPAPICPWTLFLPPSTAGIYGNFYHNTGGTWKCGMALGMGLWNSNVPFDE